MESGEAGLGRERAAERLIKDHLHLVNGTRAHWFVGAPDALAEELEAEGRRALVEAARDFDRRRGAAFATMAIWRLREAMRDERRRHDRWNCRAESLDTPAGLDQESPAGRLHDRSPGPLEQAFRQEARRVLRAAVNALPAVEREVVWRHYWQRDALPEIGAALGYGVRRATRLHGSALEQLREW